MSSAASRKLSTPWINISPVLFKKILYLTAYRLLFCLEYLMAFCVAQPIYVGRLFRGINAFVRLPQSR